MMNILLVDDEEMILRALKRALFGDKWSIFLAVSGEDALSILEQVNIDIIISDILMPKMNGAQLLEKVSMLYPNVIRASLSGYSDSDLTIKGGFFSHLAFTKPCNPKILKKEIYHISDLLNVFPDKIIQHAISGINSLPTDPECFYRTKRVIESPNSSISQVAEVICQDPAISAKVLQISNNVIFRNNEDIVCINEAVSRLGTQAISSIMDMVEIFSISNNAPRTPLYQLQTNSHKIALLASKMVHDEEKDLTYLVGLFHRIGEYVRLKITPDLMHSLLDPKKKGQDKSHIETHIFKTDSEQLAVYLLKFWGFSKKLIDAVVMQNSPEALLNKPFGAASAVYIARCIINNQPVNSQLITHCSLENQFNTWQKEPL
ncbi:HDOD domain-containing protein [Vibrio pectenicida]|uniref:HDOD domain-containing protein n=1 Tax=Vibrio pectenicida TaxID=62763 RepID=A0A427U3I3_9VIBR|nr:HDOD domain-containing protein [Vibrio pectenicida]RSD31203.1 HDOD domain-containing protein [Vibrio pectenicida]